MANLVVEALLRQLDAAFSGASDHSLLSNVPNVRQSDWTYLAGGPQRPMAQIFWHAVASTWMFDHYAFGPGE